jgi:hypothetical protein
MKSRSEVLGLAFAPNATTQVTACPTCLSPPRLHHASRAMFLKALSLPAEKCGGDIIQVILCHDVKRLSCLSKTGGIKWIFLM